MNCLAMNSPAMNSPIVHFLTYQILIRDDQNESLSSPPLSLSVTKKYILTCISGKIQSLDIGLMEPVISWTNIVR